MEVDCDMSQAASGHDFEERRVEIVFKQAFVTFPKGICLDDIFGCSFVSYAHWEGTVIPAVQTLEQV